MGMVPFNGVRIYLMTLLPRLPPEQNKLKIALYLKRIIEILSRQDPALSLYGLFVIIFQVTALARHR